MALTVRLETTGPGQGLFRISGIEASGGTLELAIQRNLDDRYLGDGQVWQITPHWHWLPGVEEIDGALHVRAGPEIVDPVAAASNMAIRVLARVQGHETSGVLRIGGHLLSSPAARAPDNSELLLDTPSEELELDLQWLAEPREPLPEPDDNRRGSRGLIVGLLSLALLLAAAVGSWQFGWLDPWREPEEKPQTAIPESSADPNPADADLISATAQGAESSTAPAEPAQDTIEAQPPTDTSETPPLQGVALARAFLSENPKPQAIQTEAERLERAADCDAAMVLYNQAAKSDPQFAFALAGRIDPRGFSKQGCIDDPDVLAASNWYQAAAESGNPAAQRRLGQLLVGQETSGPLLEDGIRWLRLAARAGDQEAKDTLAKMGKL